MKRLLSILLIVGVLALTITGCDGQAPADDTAAAIADQVQTFLIDFARQVLAAAIL